MLPPGVDRPAIGPRLRAGLSRGTRRCLRRPVTALLALAGAAYGFFFFCYPELQMKWHEPEGWKLLWYGAVLPTWLRCVLMTVGLAASTTFVLWLAFVVDEVRRGGSSTPPPP
jgi:hypothetical protein